MGTLHQLRDSYLCRMGISPLRPALAIFYFYSMISMAKTTPLTISALRECIAHFADEDSIETLWQDENGQKVLKQVSLLVHREESRNGQASLSLRVRALRAITAVREIDPPSDEDMLS